MDIYSEITERIIQQMEHGEVPWEKPWVGNESIISHATGKSYSLLNQILLGKPGEYATFNQIQNEGGHVKKGAKSKLVVFWKIIEKKNEADEIETIPFLKYSRVFHLDDCEGVKPKYIKEEPLHENVRIENAQRILDNYIQREGIKLEHDSTGGAFYRPSEDMIHLPEMNRFTGSAEYYDTAFHECIHSTGHEKRLNRSGIMSVSMFGGMEYSKEELIAEIGACSLGHMLGFETKSTFRNNAAYIQGWLKALKNDKRMLVGASSAASKAVDFILDEKVEEI